MKKFEDKKTGAIYEANTPAIIEIFEKDSNYVAIDSKKNDESKSKKNKDSKKNDESKNSEETEEVVETKE